MARKITAFLFGCTLAASSAYAQFTSTTARRVQSASSLPATCSSSTTTKDMIWQNGVGMSVCTALNTWSAVGGGVSAPGTTTLNAVARWGATDGSSIKNSIVTVADDGSIAGVKQISLDQGAGDVMFINATAAGIQMTDIGTDGLTFNLGNLTTNRSWTIGDVSGEPTIAGNSFSGTGSVVRATSPSLTTPTLGVATVTSVNKLTITAPATGSTLTIADGKTLTASNDATVSGTNTGDQVIAGGNNILQKGNGSGGTGNSGITETAAGTLRSAAGVSLDLATAMQSSDAAAVNTLLTGEGAYELASTNTTAGDTVLSGGIGTRKFTIVTFGSTGGKTVTITTNGTSTVTLTEGTDWTCVGTSNNTCASNLATAINANGTLSSKVNATASNAVVGIQRKAGGNVYAIAISTNAGAPLTATSGTDGVVKIPQTNLIANALDTTTGYGFQNTNQIFMKTAGTTRFVLDNSAANFSQNVQANASGGQFQTRSNGLFCFSNATSDVNTMDTCVSRAAAGWFAMGTGTQGNTGAGVQASGVALAINATAKTANYTTLGTDHTILVNSSGGAFTITLSSTNARTGQIYVFKCTATSSNAVTFSPSSGNIDGAASKTMTPVTVLESAMIQFDGTNWWIISSNVSAL